MYIVILLMIWVYSSDTYTKTTVCLIKIIKQSARRIVLLFKLLTCPPTSYPVHKCNVILCCIVTGEIAYEGDIL